ncbi:hypothetical protein [uncultured Bacteroides sp.]|uniref:hypothetical protein n=1 Tax=uncultured Bacteroides sp. TaxID=162156 RepID=UPI0037478C6C
MTNIKLLAFYFLATFFLGGCDTEGENTYAGYMAFQVKIDFQANKDDVYKIVFNGENIDLNKATYLSGSGEMSGTLLAYKNDETMPELETEVTVQNGTVISLVQLPDSPISLASTSTDEEDPETRNRIKMRFFYTQEELGSTAKFVFYMTDGGGDMSQWDEIANINLEKGKFSPYIEFDLAKYYTPESVAAGEYHDPIITCDIYNESGELLYTHESLAIWIDWSADLYESADENGARSGYKFMSSQLDISEEGYGGFNLVFGIPWGD